MRVSFDRLLSLPLLLLPALREAARRTWGLKIKLLPESSSLFPLPDNYLWQPPTNRKFMCGHAENAVWSHPADLFH
ncbi:hypothetical protein OJAV_G00235120 [Oryzias javanicus]|uniref:Secreted protein n=1 Tax=Oryzias javanicus TaxID=123683 RepID=A0A3S2LK11_ORYJA|nr:hypothetical protein OJAV_G00235120 [Oryzias javanicus]